MAAQPKVRYHLRLVDRHKPFDGFDFNDKPIFNDDTHSIPAIEPNLFIDDWKRYLAAISYARVLELEAQAFFVRRLEKPPARTADGHRLLS